MIIAKGAFAELITCGVVHWITVAVLMIIFIHFHPLEEVAEPFLSLGVGSGYYSAFAADAI